MFDTKATPPILRHTLVGGRIGVARVGTVGPRNPRLRSIARRGTVSNEVTLLRPRACVLSICVALSLPGCGDDKKQAQAAPSKVAPAAERKVAEPPTPDPGVRDDGSIVSAVAWFEGPLHEALAQAKGEDKLVFVDVGAYWCPPCHELDETVFTEARVGEYLGEHFVAMHVDAEKGEGPDLVDRYHVQAFPTLLVLEPSGVEKGRVVDYLPPDELVEALQRIAAGDNVLADLAQAVEAAPDDLQARYRLGHALTLAARRDEANEHFEAVLLADPHNEMGLASKIAHDRALFFTLKLDRDPNKAIEQWKTLQKRYPDSKEAIRSHRMIGRALHEMGRDEEAMASLDRMLAEDPTDPALAASYGWFSFRQKVGMQKALAAVEAALKEAPDEAELHYLRAELKHLLGDDAAALASMRTASDKEPKSAYYKRQVRRFEDMAGS